MEYLIPSYFSNVECQRCGKCCKGWNIEVTPLEMKKIMLKIKELPKDERDKMGFNIYKEDNGEISKAYFKLINDKCCFLDENNLCFIHKNFGEECKADVCTSYPLYAIKTPKVTYVNLSMSCISALMCIFTNKKMIITNPNNYSQKKVSLKNVDVSLNVQISLDHYFYSWEDFYKFQKYISTSDCSPIILMCELWEKMKFLGRSYSSKHKFEDIFSMQVVNIFNKEYSNLSAIIEVMSIWEKEDDDITHIIFSKNYLIEKLKINCNNVSKRDEQIYKEYLVNSIDEEMLNVIENYLRAHLFINELYFEYHIVKSLEIMGLVVAVIMFVALCAKGTEVKIRQEDMISAIYTIEKHFFHSEVINKITNLNIPPKFTLSPLLEKIKEENFNENRRVL